MVSQSLSNRYSRPVYFVVRQHSPLFYLFTSRVFSNAHVFARQAVTYGPKDKSM